MRLSALCVAIILSAAVVTGTRTTSIVACSLALGLKPFATCDIDGHLAYTAAAVVVRSAASSITFLAMTPTDEVFTVAEPVQETPSELRALLPTHMLATEDVESQVFLLVQSEARLDASVTIWLEVTFDETPTVDRSSAYTVDAAEAAAEQEHDRMLAAATPSSTRSKKPAVSATRSRVAAAAVVTRTRTPAAAVTPSRTRTPAAIVTRTRTPAAAVTPSRTRTPVAGASRTRSTLPAVTPTRTRTPVAGASRTRSAVPAVTPTRTRTTSPAKPLASTTRSLSPSRTPSKNSSKSSTNTASAAVSEAPVAASPSADAVLASPSVDPAVVASPSADPAVVDTSASVTAAPAASSADNGTASPSPSPASGGAVLTPVGSSTGKKGLSSGAIGGIVVASVASVMALAVIATMATKRARASSAAASSSNHADSKLPAPQAMEQQLDDAEKGATVADVTAVDANATAGTVPAITSADAAPQTVVVVGGADHKKAHRHHKSRKSGRGRSSSPRRSPRHHSVSGSSDDDGYWGGDAQAQVSTRRPHSPRHSERPRRMSARAQEEGAGAGAGAVTPGGLAHRLAHASNDTVLDFEDTLMQEFAKRAREQQSFQHKISATLGSPRAGTPSPAPQASPRGSGRLVSLAPMHAVAVGSPTVGALVQARAAQAQQAQQSQMAVFMQTQMALQKQLLEQQAAMAAFMMRQSGAGAGAGAPVTPHPVAALQHMTRRPGTVNPKGGMPTKGQTVVYY